MSEEVLDDGIEAVGVWAVKIDKNEATYPFENTTKEDLAQKVQTFLGKEKYILKVGNNQNGEYHRGSKVLRFLLGAFHKHFVWKVTIFDEGDLVILRIRKNEKGYMGGVIGVSQVGTEWQRLTRILKEYHQRQHTPKNE
ncbi:hypothetical protein K6119_08650 [Paracrocinitomix mangrovi]|uniref:hypothetical protein n=1 Tax=Paracrocinitomix mangrovi TaxID=2862509 RepID=UPI001C8D1417|nr:hypothetical protein [Paracrocinitomix mangrovi]UKN03581.1 hypothetical protein K6119_08650 [Paracrocinitomix mangrovi]